MTSGNHAIAWLIAGTLLGWLALPLTALAEPGKELQLQPQRAPQQLTTQPTPVERTIVSAKRTASLSRRHLTGITRLTPSQQKARLEAVMNDMRRLQGELDRVNARLSRTKPDHLPASRLARMRADLQSVRRDLSVMLRSTRDRCRASCTAFYSNLSTENQIRNMAAAECIERCGRRPLCMTSCLEEYNAMSAEAVRQDLIQRCRSDCEEPVTGDDCGCSGLSGAQREVCETKCLFRQAADMIKNVQEASTGAIQNMAR